MPVLKRVLVGLALAVGLGAVAGLLGIWWIGAWHLVFPTDAHDTTPPALADDFGADAKLRVLVYSKTNAFRHREGIAAAHELFDSIAAERGWAVFHSENSAIFRPELLDRFDVVVFASATGDHASDAQQAAFRTWLEGGGGWVGIHAAGDGSHEGWRWYAKQLVSGRYLGHILGPQTQEARVVVEDRSHPITRDLPPEFRHAEEWYAWDRGAREAGFRVLLSVDESTYTPRIRAMGQDVDIAMGDHPIVWSRCLGRGRAAYTAMGHWGDAYQQAYTRTLLRNAVEWTAGHGAPPCNDGL